MKVKHWIAVVLVLIAALFLLHNFMSHGGMQGIKSGLGFGGFQ